MFQNNLPQNFFMMSSLEMKRSSQVDMSLIVRTSGLAKFVYKKVSAPF